MSAKPGATRSKRAGNEHAHPDIKWGVAQPGDDEPRRQGCDEEAEARGGIVSIRSVGLHRGFFLCTLHMMVLYMPGRDRDVTGCQGSTTNPCQDAHDG